MAPKARASSEHQTPPHPKSPCSETPIPAHHVVIPTTVSPTHPSPPSVYSPPTAPPFPALTWPPPAPDPQARSLYVCFLCRGYSPGSRARVRRTCDIPPGAGLDGDPGGLGGGVSRAGSRFLGVGRGRSWLVVGVGVEYAGDVMRGIGWVEEWSRGV